MSDSEQLIIIKEELKQLRMLVAKLEKTVREDMNGMNDRVREVEEGLDSMERYDSDSVKTLVEEEVQSLAKSCKLD